MAETNVYKVLAQGQFASSVASLGGPAAGKSWLIGAINVVNLDTVARTYRLLVNGTADTNQISADAESLGANERDEWMFPSPLALGGTAGDTVRGFASAATVVTYTIWGDEVTL